MNITFECEREANGRWLTEVAQLQGLPGHGQSPAEAISNAENLALRVLADAASNVQLPYFQNAHGH